jgi:hypothetical protein
MITINSNIDINKVLIFKKIRFNASYNPSTQVGEVFKVHNENVSLQDIENNFETWKQEYLNYLPTLEILENRKRAYPSIQEQLDMQYWDKVNGTDNWEQAINAIKTQYPKA